MQNLKEMVRLSIEQKQICLECDFDDLPYKWVYGDEMRLNQIYLNLLTNAVKYTDKGGKILLRLQEKRITGLIFAAALAMFGCSKKKMHHLSQNWIQVRSRGICKWKRSFGVFYKFL